MKRITQFKIQSISKASASKLKGGGYFCDVYLGYVSETGETYKSRKMAYATKLDEIRRTEGMDAALAAGGARFLSRYD